MRLGSEPRLLCRVGLRIDIHCLLAALGAALGGTATLASGPPVEVLLLTQLALVRGAWKDMDISKVLYARSAGFSDLI